MSTGAVDRPKRGFGRARKAANSKQVKLRLTHIDFWSAIRVGLVIQIALAIATIAGFFVIWLVLGSTGLINNLGTLIGSAVGSTEGTAAANTLSLPTMMSFAVALSVFNIIVGTLLAGIGALVFNVIAKLTGGLLVGFTNH